VGTRDRAGVEVDRPAAEEPVLDLLALEQLVQLADCGELGVCAGSMRSIVRRRPG
jgi:hypothetical protein